MSKVTIETINEKPCTVIRKAFDAQWVKEQLAMGNSVIVETKNENQGGRISLCGFWDIYTIYRDTKGFEIPDHWVENTLTTLPALPKHPKPEDARRLYRYASHGLYAMTKNGGKYVGRKYNTQEDQFATLMSMVMGKRSSFPLTHATLEGERVEIAIEDGEDDNSR